MSDANEQPSFWRIQDSQGRYHCDWRLTTVNCVEENALRWMYSVNAAVSGVATIIAAALLYWRLYHRNQKIFDFQTGFLRPKPIESMALFGVIFNLLQTIHAIIMVTDVAPTPIFRSIFFELPWQFGFCALACYLFGVAHTLSDSSKFIYSAWIRSPIIVDTICLLVITLPFVTNNICSVAAGVFAARGNNELAERFTNALYALWTLYTVFLGILILYAGLRLLHLLNHNLLMQSNRQLNIGKIKTGALKVRIIMAAGCLCLWIFAIILLLYACIRLTISQNYAFNMIIAVIWRFDGTFATLVVEFAVILNPRMTASLAHLSFGSEPSNTTVLSDSRQFTLDDDNARSKERFSGSRNPGDVKDTWIPVYAMGTEEYKRNMLAQITRPEPSFSKVEEDRLQYDAMTNQLRTSPPHYLSYEDRRAETNESVESSLFADSTISASHLLTSSASSRPII
ncbi:uncharacterized protein BYT42DRAFT_560872 [Radiomyces spectabilis]|uniref:uncharacterized protein n=1 Tax=Radiomyces spectabilis TaxID=64574 RepID=UPI00221F1F67|nr:uncharacterized protein BYT42DRAFT_560872 [Radiomyces spectabilis]KAI8388680.1 hypothetical protein BYT42DRAFT_560872 [Radiomyces spectabilis]